MSVDIAAELRAAEYLHARERNPMTGEMVIITPELRTALLDELDALRADAERWRAQRDHGIVVFECVVERRGIRSTATDAEWERWDEHSGWGTNKTGYTEYPTMDEAIDAAIARPAEGK